MAPRERVSFQMLKVGSCRHLECLAFRGGRWQSTEFPSLCALIKHPSRGWILYDTGYSEHFLEATRVFPGRLYSLATPPKLPASECLLTQLRKKGIAASDIRLVLISHFHGDHVGGLRDFPNSSFIACRDDWRQVKDVAPWRGIFDGFLPTLLPDNFESRLHFVEDYPRIDLPAWLLPFTHGYDLFGDASLIATPLPGHSRSQMGLVLRDQTDRIRFLVADACWSMPACKNKKLPSRLTNWLFANQKQYATTFFALHDLAVREPALTLLPSHCLESWKALEHEHA